MADIIFASYENRAINEPLLGSEENQMASRQEAPLKRHSSAAGAIFNLSTSVIGAGIMALPYTLKILGLVPGILVIVLVGLLSETSLKMLIKYSRLANSTSYYSVMKHSFGKPGRQLVQFSIVVNLFGMLIAYMVIIGDVFSGTSDGGVHHPGLLEAWFGAQWWTSRAFVIFFVSLTVFLPLAKHKHIGSLDKYSAIAVALAVVFVVITAGSSIYKIFNGGVEMPKLFPEIKDWTSIWNCFTTVPVLVTAYICHYNVHSIHNELKEESEIEKVITLSLIFCTIIYVATTFFAFLLFGDSILGDVLANFSADLGIPYGSVINIIVRLSYGVHIILVFPVVFFAFRLNVDALLFYRKKAVELTKKRFRIMTVILLLVIYTIANYVPSIWDAFQIVGATSGISIGFIFPASIALKNSDGDGGRRIKILAIFMIVISVFSSTVALSSDIYTIILKMRKSALGI